MFPTVPMYNILILDLSLVDSTTACRAPALDNKFYDNRYIPLPTLNTSTGTCILTATVLIIY